VFPGRGGGKKGERVRKDYFVEHLLHPLREKKGLPQEKTTSARRAKREEEG